MRETVQVARVDHARALDLAVLELSLARDLPSVVEVIRRCARIVTRADGVTFVLREGDEVYYYDEEAISPLWKGRRFSTEACISGWVMTHKTQVAIEDIYKDDRIPIAAYRPTFVRSLVMTPVRSEDPIAAIGAYWSERHVARDDELEALRVLANAAAVAITNAHLLAELERLLASERRARQEAEEAARAKDELLAMLGHELRNPLAPIVTSLEIMKLKGSADDRERDVIERHVRRLTRLVNDLLDVSRLTRGGLDLDIERCDLADLVARAVESCRSLIEKKRHALHVELAEGLVVEADAGRIVQVICNLLINAAQYTPAGGHLSVELARNGDHAEIAVRDDGPGIDEQLKPRVFELFSQGRRSLARADGGLGLGLAIVRSLVEQHGGGVALHPSTTGTDVRVRLPLRG